MIYLQAANNLERPFQFGATVPYESTFLLIGGGTPYRDTVHKYIPSDDSWELMPGRLSVGRETPAAMLVSLDALPSCSGDDAAEKKPRFGANATATAYNPDLDPNQSNGSG